MLANGRIIGVATGQVEEMLRRAVAPYALRQAPWPRALQSALGLPGQCAFSMARSLDREDRYRWIGPVARMDWVLYARNDDKRAPASLEQVHGALIGGGMVRTVFWLDDVAQRHDPAHARTAYAQ